MVEEYPTSHEGVVKIEAGTSALKERLPAGFWRYRLDPVPSDMGLLTHTMSNSDR